MRRVVKFEDRNKPAHTQLNEWLAMNPEATLIDIKPHFSTHSFVTIHAIVEIPDKAKEEKAE